MDRKLSFIFTPDGFYPDMAGSGSAGTQAEETVRWTQDGGFPALYDLGLKTAQGEMSPSARFLYKISLSDIVCFLPAAYRTSGTGTGTGTGAGTGSG